MGVDISHGCWDGSYWAFMIWRQKIATLAGLPPLELMEGFFRNKNLDSAPPYYDALPIRWDSLKPDPLHILLNHHDHDGTIAAADCGPIADRLSKLLPLMPEGPLEGDYRQRTLAFICGLRLASELGEDVWFQ